jgi:PST family polysaccharide transporter
MLRNKQNPFDTSHLDKSLKKRSIQSGAVTVGSQGLKMMIQMGSTMILARILVPEDYGIMAMVMAIAGFARMFINMGLSAATIQRADINQAQVSTLFWINAGMGLLLMILLASLSPVVAWFYNTPELTWVTVAMSTMFLLNGLGVQHSALMSRQMRFFAIAAINVVSMIAGITVAIFAALQGLGYWALVLNSIVNSFCTVSLKWLTVRWLPSLPSRASGVGSMIKFGSDLLGFNIVNYFARNLDNILIGRFHGSGPLGFYSKAYQLLMMPISNLRDPLLRVATPALSKLQNEPENYRKYFIKLVSLLAFVSMPLVTFLFVCSDQIIGFILGPEWIEASELFKILALVALIQPVVSTQGLVMITTGRSRRYLIIGVLGAAMTSLAFALGVPWGAKGVAIAYAISVYVKFFPFLYAAFKDTPVDISNFLLAICRPFIASLIMGIVCYVLVYYLQFNSNLPILFISFIASAIIYLVSITIVSGSTRDLWEYYEYGRLAFGKR